MNQIESKLIRLNPHRIHTEEVAQIFRAIEPRYGAAVADFFRYCVLYREGGVYLDAKAGMTRSFAEILAEQGEPALLVGYTGFHYVDELLAAPGAGAARFGVLPGRTPAEEEAGEAPAAHHEICQWLIAARAEHPALLRVLRDVAREAPRLHINSLLA